MSGMRNIDARNIGLRNIVVADTRICSIDGEHGELIYRGYDILDLVTHSTFEETSYLLLFGDLPTQEELSKFITDLKNNREIPDALYQNLKNRPFTLLRWTYFNLVFHSYQIMIWIYMMIRVK